MKIYFGNPIVAYIDNDVVSTETFFDGYVYENREVNMKQVKDIICGLEKLRSKPEKITIDSGTHLDMDNVYYRRFPEEVIDRVWKTIGDWRYGEREVYIKGNRIYVKEGGYEIVLPKKMITDYDHNTLKMMFYI